MVKLNLESTGDRLMKFILLLKATELSKEILTTAPVLLRSILDPHSVIKFLDVMRDSEASTLLRAYLFTPLHASRLLLAANEQSMQTLSNVFVGESVKPTAHNLHVL